MKQEPLTNLGDLGPPPVRPRAEPLSHRLPLQGGVLEASTRLPVELYHSPLEGESQKPSRMAKADAVGGRRRASWMRPQPAKRRLMRRGQGSAPDRATGRLKPVATGVLPIRPATSPGLCFDPVHAVPAGRVAGCRIAGKLSGTERECMRAGRPRSRVGRSPCRCGRAVTLGGPSGAFVAFRGSLLFSVVSDKLFSHPFRSEARPCQAGGPADSRSGSTRSLGLSRPSTSRPLTWARMRWICRKPSVRAAGPGCRM